MALRVGTNVAALVVIELGAADRTKFPPVVILVRLILQCFSFTHDHHLLDRLASAMGA
jgi:hypothetical protein